MKKRGLSLVQGTGPFHVIADSNRRMDKARRIEQDMHRKRKVQIPKKIFLVSRGRLSEEERE